MYDYFLGFLNPKIRRILRKTLPGFVSNLGIQRILLDLDVINLWFKAVLYRIRRLGLFAAFKKSICPSYIPLYYIDIGTHEMARELNFYLDKIAPVIAPHSRIFGFEASSSTFDKVAHNLKGKSNVTLYNKALVSGSRSGTKIRLYKNSSSSVADSVFRKSNLFEDVDTCVLSDFVRKKIKNIDRSIIIIRMNIEGSEKDVIDDLCASGLVSRIAGFFGMWNDVAAIDPEKGIQFERQLKKNRIVNFTFNDRDFQDSRRMALITYHFNSVILERVSQIFDT